MALLQALLNTLSHIGRDDASKLLQLRSIEGVLPAERRFHNIIVQGEESLRGLLDTGVFAREARDEEGVVAAGVELRVQGTLREDCHLVCCEPVGDAICAVLEGELCDQAAFDDDVDLRAARVDVWGVETAGFEEAEGHADPRADERWAGFAICFDGVAAFAGRDGV